jgi:hypothetical protein
MKVLLSLIKYGLTFIFLTNPRFFMNKQEIISRCREIVREKMKNHVDVAILDTTNDDSMETMLALLELEKEGFIEVTHRPYNIISTFRLR